MFNKHLVGSKDILKNLAEYKNKQTAEIKAIRENADYSEKYQNEKIAELETQAQSKIVNDVNSIKSYMQEWSNEQNKMPFDLDFISKLATVLQELPNNALYNLIELYRGNFNMVDTLYHIALKQQDNADKQGVKLDLSKMGNNPSNVIEMFKLQYNKAGMPPKYYTLSEYTEKLNTKLDELATNKATENQVLAMLNIAQTAMGGEKWEYFNSAGFNFNFQTAREKNNAVVQDQQKQKADTFNFNFNK